MTEKDWSICPKSVDGKHSPDPASIVPADDAGRGRGTDWIIEIACRRCGQFGSMRIDPAEIDW